MAVSGQLCRVAEGLSYRDHAKTLSHRHPPGRLAIVAVSAVRGRLRCLGPAEILRGRLRFS